MTPEEFDQSFDRFEFSAFRLEVLQRYAVSAEDARMRAFREGTPRPERSVRTSPWLQRIAATTMAGKAWSRLHLIQEPLSEYLRYELIGYVESCACGEEIRLAYPPDERPALVDFWLFDSSTPGAFAVLMHYSDDGEVLGYEYVDKSLEVAELETVRDLVWSRSWSLAEHLARNPVQ
ncbi:MAG: DUF6879 family protein [Pseudonocardiaceae bacterium]